MVGAVRLRTRFGCAFGIFVDVTGNLVDGSGQLLHGTCLLRGAIAERLRAAGYLLAAGRHIIRHRVDLPQRRIEIVYGLISISGQLAVTTGIDVVIITVPGEIALGNGRQTPIQIVNDEGQLLNGQSDAVCQTPQFVFRLIPNYRPIKLALRHILHGDVDLFQGRYNGFGQHSAGNDGNQNSQHQHHR